MDQVRHQHWIGQYSEWLQQDRQAAAALEALPAEFSRIHSAVSEMYRDGLETSPAIYGEHEARQAFTTRPADKYGKTVDFWANDARTVGEVLATAAAKVEAAIPLINEGLKLSGLPVDKDMTDKIMVDLMPISQQAQALQKKIVAGRDIA